MPARMRPDGGQDVHRKFLNQFACRKSNSATQRPSPLSAEEHAAHRKQLEGIHFVQSKFSAEHEINVTGIFGKWKRYCTEKDVGEWKVTLQNIGRELIMDFFLFVCESYKVRSWGTSKVYIRQFQEFYTTVTARPAELVNGERRDPKDGSRKELFHLKAGTYFEQVAADDDIAPDKVSQKLYSLLSRETEGRGRPKALCYEDIMMMMVRHPQTGQTIPAMAIKFIHHKGADRKPKPTIFFFTPTKKQTFCATKIVGGNQSTPLRWKDSKLKTPVFRRFRRDGTFEGEKAMLYSTLRDAMKQQSLDAGFERHWTPRFCRRGASNAANGSASDAVRDQMMRHDPKFATFHGAYLNEMVQFDMQNTFLGEQAEDQLYKLFAHVSLTRDPRAVRDMVPEEVWANMEPDPEIVALEQRRTALKGGSYQVQDQRNEAEVRYLTDQIRLKTAQLEKQIVKDWREYYFYNRPTWDIERQARGEPDEEHVEPTITLSILERVKLANILCSRCEDDDDALQRRTMAIELMVALCNKRETGKRRRLSPKLKVTPMKEESPEFEVEPNVDPFPLLLDVKQCPDCFGDERLTVEEFG
ncbi:hypothetical protein DL764_005235 [Monosporascus ibericus]|uniref:FluG domain-containing protein n=1 Tax=Monosporascus ibericus TaxID=155417 RepID=A0A4Q4TCI0_9PEZI|nr:hypothetical protein DL764_005235 [Monosporascus ibericus]